MDKAFKALLYVLINVPGNILAGIQGLRQAPGEAVERELDDGAGERRGEKTD